MNESQDEIIGENQEDIDAARWRAEGLLFSQTRWEDEEGDYDINGLREGTRRAIDQLPPHLQEGYRKIYFQGRVRKPGEGMI